MWAVALGSQADALRRKSDNRHGGSRHKECCCPKGRLRSDKKEERGWSFEICDLIPGIVGT